MWIKDEVTTGYELEQRLWGQAVDTWKTICEADKEEQAFQYFEDIFCGEEAINITSINDILAYDEQDLMEYLGLNKKDEEDELVFNEMDLDTMEGEDVDSTVVEFLRNRFKERNLPLLYITIAEIEDELLMELTDEDKEVLIDLG